MSGSSTFRTSTTRPRARPAGQVISYGDPKVPQLIFNAIDEQPGALLTVFVQYGTVSGKNVQLPVLDGSESAYRTLLPSPTPTPTAPIACGDSTPSPTDTPTPTDSPSPTSTPTVGCPGPAAN
jgi:hypothetical protein